ncbi:MAG: SH3 domain-containing protein [Anaerolineae bacterium]
MRFRYSLFMLLGLVLVLSPVVRALQDATCPDIVNRALSELGQNCDALDRNSACYGYNRVNTTFLEQQPDDFFSKASDRSELLLIDDIATAPLDEVNDTWGMAVMKVQANVPNSLPGQAVTFVLMGDTQVRNDVAPSEAFIPSDPVAVKTIGNANIRSGASTNANVIGSVPSGTDMEADGRSTDSKWVRILYKESPGWISTQLLNASVDVAALPVITQESRTPMQAFHVTTGVRGASCDQAPDVLLVQGPENIKVNLTLNGADIRIGSTIVIQSVKKTFKELLEDERLLKEFGGSLTDKNADGDLVCNVIQLMVVDGGASLNDGVVNLPTGFTADTINCGGADRTSVFTIPWAGSRPLTPEELAYLKPLEGLPPNILNYPIRIPTLADIQRILAALGGGIGGQATRGPAADKVNCAPFKPTSPLGQMPANGVQFYWDAAPGATSYTVRVYDSGGATVGEFSTNAPQTTVGGTPSGTGSLSWDVSAYYNGVLACTTGRAGVLRDATYGVPVGQPAGPGYVTSCLNILYDPPCNSPCTSGAVCDMYGKAYYCTCPA